jgi:MFS transporter, putative metabolite:H+ symporter
LTAQPAAHNRWRRDDPEKLGAAKEEEMPGQTSEDLLTLFDTAPLNRRYWVSFAIMSGVFLLDFFDFFLIAFVMSVIGPQWHLTYGQGALILYGAGVGAIIGSLVWGALGDRFGRKMQCVTGTFICGISAGMIGFLPTGAWVPLAALRFLIGFGLAAGVTPALTIVVELTRRGGAPA